MIDRLYVHNFRCFENFALDLAGRSSALLIGRNGSGKSTVLHCLKLFQSICRGSGRVAGLISASDFTQHRTTQPMRFEVDLTLVSRRFNYSVSFEWPTGFREARILDEGLSVDGTPVFTRHQAQVQLANGPAFGLDWHILALPVINERPGQLAIREVKEFFATMVLMAPIPANMTGFSEGPSMELLHDAANYASCLRALLDHRPAAYSAFDSYVKTLIPDFSSIENPPRGEKGTQLKVTFEQQNPRRSLPLEFNALSDGEKCFFLSAFVIASNAVGSPVFCMWDEPDNHLSLSEVGQFMTGLRKMTNQSGQFIATTHHPETIRKFSDETTFVLARKSHLDPTVVRPLTDFAYGGDLINALIRDEIIG
ncbi:MAG TPA: AAA family ATPase [Pirellulales bacterium]|jgi:ABC-type lipoprotein export system ATPase subunit|nr:AAA family ATPase [Pirellulales bacterium]